jgi:hypothetical protein
MAINLSRNTRLWVSTVKTGHNNSNTFEIPVQEGYSLSQSVATADVSVEEAGPVPTRGGKRFNTNLDPVDWSFSTYFNPYVNSLESNIYAVDMIMWHALATSNAVGVDFDGAAPLGTGSLTSGDTTSFAVDFSNNSAHVLTTLYLYFEIDNDVYLVDAAQVGQAEISIDISDIAMVAWSGQALSYTRLGAAPAFIAGGGLEFVDTTPTADKYVAISSAKKFLVNKLTTMDFQSDVSGTSLFYNIPLTSGSITINNNVTYLTPNTLAEVDTPIGSFTGSFEVTGSLDAYMRSTGADGVLVGDAKGTTELLEDMLGNTSKVTNISDATIYIGGETTGTSQIKINMPTLHIAVPSLSVDDVISTSIEFKAVPTSADLESGDELTVEMFTAIA